MIESDLITALPELFLICASLVLLMLGVFGASYRTINWLGVAALIGALGILVLAPSGEAQAFNELFRRDSFAEFMKGLVLIGTATTMIMSLGYVEREGMARFEFPVLMLFATVGMLLMISANDLIALYIGLEIQSLSLYVIAAFRRDAVRSAEAGLKYFVLGALSSGMLLYGASFVYGFSGTTSFPGLATVFSEGEPGIGLIVGLVFVAAGLAFKISAVPFHMWTPDVYEGSPTVVTAFFASAPKVAAMALIVSVMMGPFYELRDQWRQIVVFISLASMILGALAAIQQTNIKRLMAYSSIGHIGFALVGLAAGTQDGVRGVIIYMAIYLVMNLGTFACILAMKQRDRMVEGLDDLKGLSKTNPLIAAALMVFMFSMAGIPPLAGFWGKVYVFLPALEAGLYTLAVVGILTSVVSAFYYLRIIKLMYFDEPKDGFDTPLAPELRIVMAVSALAVLLLTVAPEALFSGAEVSQLLARAG